MDFKEREKRREKWASIQAKQASGNVIKNCMAVRVFKYCKQFLKTGKAYFFFGDL